MSFFLGESIDEYAQSLLKLEGSKEGKREKEGRKRKGNKEKEALVLTRTSHNIVEKLICEIRCSSIPTQAISVIMAFDLKLIPLFDGTASGQLVVEWVEKAELVRQLSGVKNVECVVPMRLSGSAYAVYHQLSEGKRADFACIKDDLYTAFALNPVTAYKQFTACHLHLGETVDVFLAELRKLATRRYDGAGFGLCVHCYVTRACGETSSGRRLANI